MIRIFRHYISSAYFLLLVIEFCVFFAAMFYGVKLPLLMTAATWYSSRQILEASSIFAAVLSFSCAAMGLYRHSLSLQDYNLLARVCASFTTCIVLLAIIYYFFPDLLIGCSVLAGAFACALLGIFCSRELFYKFANLEKFKKRVLVIGSGAKAKNCPQ